jgi:excinuclease ABC subunit A
MTEKAQNSGTVNQVTQENDEFLHEIVIRGARTNNLKNVDLTIPKNKLIVVTGVSGSGKSSLIMDTLYAEGQRRYVESLSSYARQFLNRMKKPEVDFISGISPAIAIEQKVSSGNARSTVGTLTEIYDYLRLLFARIGKTYSPVSGQQVTRHHVSDVVDFIRSLPEDTRLMIGMPVFQEQGDRTLDKQLGLLLEKGYTRLLSGEQVTDIETFLEGNGPELQWLINDLALKKVYIIIDRVVASREEANLKRIADSADTAFKESHGYCVVIQPGIEPVEFSSKFELDGISFIEPDQNLFNFNNSLGACKKCEGYGKTIGIDPEKVVPDDSKSVYEGAVVCWSGAKHGSWKEDLIMHSEVLDFPIHKPYRDLTVEQRTVLWEGKGSFSGINAFFQKIESKLYKIQNRVLLARYRGRTTCNECKGGRLRKEASYIRVGTKNIMELTKIPVDQLKQYFDELWLSESDLAIGRRILTEIKSRLEVMVDVGLGYLTLDRLSATLSGGETQRINLTRILGSNLTNSLYILDEPSIGLHPKDIDRMLVVLKKLRDLDNTVVVVEHEELIIREADHIIDVGPMAGVHGGSITFNGPYAEFIQLGDSNLTSSFLTGKQRIETPDSRRQIFSRIKIHDARRHNLKGIDADIPLQCLVVVTGVSGSGKSTLVREVLEPSLRAYLERDRSDAEHKMLRYIGGDVDYIDQVEFVSQRPIGKSSRSNPITYLKAYDAIRKLFAAQQLSKIRGYKPGHFSFNVDGGRCDECKGEGEITVEMQFLADVKLQCESCNGMRFKKELLEVQYRGKNINDVLEMTVEEALVFFNDNRELRTKLQALDDVGLSYIKLGQSSSSLSGGEAQRVKLASFLQLEQTDKRMLFIFDEPTTGLHYYDVKKLLTALNALVEKGHTVLVVEHNLDVIKSADWLVDLGPVGGEAGGHLVFQGRPEEIVQVEESYTGQFLKERM